MKAKYKLGTLVESRDAHGTSSFEKVNGIITYADGHRYTLEGYEPNEAVREEDIVNAYRPVVARVFKPRAARAPKSEKKTKSNSASASL